jgi:hypothetical protein
MISFFAKWKADFEEVKPNIFIPSQTENLAFNIGIKSQLEKIEKNPIGKRLLDKIQGCSAPIFVVWDNDDSTISISSQEYKVASKMPPVIVKCSMKDTRCYSIQGEAIPFPIHVVLFHELTHAHHTLSGKRATSQLTDPLVWESDEEYKTIIGFPSKKGSRNKPKITENAFRQAENLPERFGSWGPSGCDEREALCVARIKIVGKIHAQNLLASSSSFSPPPIAMCTLNDLGNPNHCIVAATIEGVNRDFSQNKKAVSNFFWIDPSTSLDSLMGPRSYDRFSMDTSFSEAIKNAAIIVFPKLTTTDFKVKSFGFYRVSQLELNILQNNIPNIENI